MKFRYYVTPNDYLLAELKGIPKNVVYARAFQYGWNIDRACSEPLHHQFSKNITNTMIETLKAHNVSLDQFRKRVLQLGWDIERALTTPVMTKHETAIAGSNTRRKITEEQYITAELNNISRNTFTKRVLRSHWSIDKATNTPILNRHECAELSCMGKLCL